MSGVSQAIDGAPHICKAPCQFGWDWAPKLPSISIWKDVRLEERSAARLEDVHLRQGHHPDGVVTVRADVQVEAWGDGELDAVLTVTPADEGAAYEARSRIVDDGATLGIRGT